MTGKIMPLRGRDTSTIQAAADAFLSSPRYANPNTRRGYASVLDRLLAQIGASRPLAEVSGEELASLLEQLWGQRGPGDLEPQPRRHHRLAVLVRRQPAARSGPARQGRTAPRAPQRHPSTAPPGDRPGAKRPRRSAAGEDPVADAVRDRRQGQRGAGAEHRRSRPGRPTGPGPFQGRRHRMDLLGFWYCAPAAPPHPRPPIRTALPVRTSTRPGLPPRSPGPVPGHRTGPARLRPRPDPVHPLHRVATAPAPPLGSNPPRRARSCIRCNIPSPAWGRCSRGCGVTGRLAGARAGRGTRRGPGVTGSWLRWMAGCGVQIGWAG
jgi:hypothetical protein